MRVHAVRLKPGSDLKAELERHSQARARRRLHPHLCRQPLPRAPLDQAPRAWRLDGWWRLRSGLAACTPIQVVFFARMTPLMQPMASRLFIDVDDYWEAHCGALVKGAASFSDFERRIRSIGYNSQNPSYDSDLMAV